VRFGVPKVNQDPQPPNAAKGPYPPTKPQFPAPGWTPLTDGGGGNHGQGAGHQRHNPLRNGPNNGQGRQHGRSPNHIRSAFDRLRGLENRRGGNITKPVATTAAPTNLNANTVQQQIEALGDNPANAMAFSSFTPGPGQVDPRDSKYWANVSTLLFNTQGDFNQLQLQQQRAGLDAEKGLGDLATNRQREQRSLAEEAMRSGLSSSGWRDRTDAEDTGDFLRDYEDFQTGTARDKADRSAAMSRVIQNFIAGERDLSLDALTSYDQSQRDSAAEGAPVYDRADVRGIIKALRKRGPRGRR
jgi:hypothetical protein